MTHVKHHPPSSNFMNQIIFVPEILKHQLTGDSEQLTLAAGYMMMVVVKTGSSRSGTDERGKCDNIGLSAACLSNEAMIRSVVVADA